MGISLSNDCLMIIGGQEYLLCTVTLVIVCVRFYEVRYTTFVTLGDQLKAGFKLKYFQLVTYIACEHMGLLGRYYGIT